MKKFDFPLDRVTDFRRMQARLEETKLESLYAELRALDSREAALIQECADAEKSLKSSACVTSFDLRTLDSYRVAMKEERKRLDLARTGCRKRIDAQLQVVTVKRRDLRLLEKLKDQRFETWEKDMFKELDQQAEETYLSKWNSSR